MEARAKAIQENNVELLNSGALDDPMAGKAGTRWRDPKRLQSKAMIQTKELYQSIEKELSQSTASSQNEGEEEVRLLENGNAGDEGGDEMDVEAAKDGQEVSGGKPKGQPKDDRDGNAKDASDGVTKDASEGDAKGGESNQQLVKVDKSAMALDASQLLVVPEEWKNVYPKNKHGKKIVLADQATAEERMQPTAPVEAQLKMSEWKEDMPDSITDEIDSIFRSDEEIAKKEVIFNKINKDYIEQQERKEKERLAAEAADKGREEDMAAQAEGHMRYVKRGRKKKSDRAGIEKSTEELLLAEVKNRKISRKINYDAMSSIFDDEGTFATDTTTTMTEGGMEFGEL